MSFGQMSSVINTYWSPTFSFVDKWMLWLAHISLKRKEEAWSWYNIIIHFCKFTYILKDIWVSDASKISSCGCPIGTRANKRCLVWVYRIKSISIQVKNKRTKSETSNQKSKAKKRINGDPEAKGINSSKKKGELC